MSTQDSNGKIIRGVMVSFDILDKREIDKVNNEINETFGFEPTSEKSVIMGLSQGSYEVNQTVWKIESVPTGILKNICEKKGFPFDSELVERYVQSIQVRGYDSPRLPFYVLMFTVLLDEDALNSCEDLRTNLLRVASAFRLYFESLNGLTNRIASFSPRISLITQLWVKVDKQHISRMRNTGVDLISKNEEILESHGQRKKLSNELRKLEPFNLSAPVGDIHSHILNGENVIVILGHMTQIALGGLRTPYIQYLSYDDELLKSKPSSLYSNLIEVTAYGLEGIVLWGYAYLVALISMVIYLSHIALEGAGIDNQLSKLRDSIVRENSEHVVDKHLSELSSYGTRISSLLHILGNFSRHWETAVRQISKGKDGFAVEVPIETPDFFGRIANKSIGYLGTLANHILQILEHSKESLAQQESELASLRMHVSDIVNLKISRGNENLQKSVKRLTMISVIITIVALTVSIYSGWYSFQIASLDYQRTHPEGIYIVSVDFLGYDSPTNSDQFRITITYQGKGVSRYLRLSVGIVGANPTVVSKANLEVMEADIILTRDYVDGLVGWVDYDIQRLTVNDRTKLNILDFSSDVDVTINNNT